jgi:DNA-binding transcriptional regulator YiaG
MHARTKQLRKIRDQLKLTHPQIAAVTLSSLQSVVSWFIDPASENHRIVPAKALRLLEVETGIAKPRFVELGAPLAKKKK